MPQISLTISCVSNEFGFYRNKMQSEFARPKLHIYIQEDFYASGSSTMQKLDDYIFNSDAVIHLCGDMTGSMAKPISVEYIREKYPDFGIRFPKMLPVINGEEQLSYTQWEAWLATYHKKALFIATPTKEAPRDNGYKLILEEHRLQQLHLKWLRDYERYDEIRFSTVEDLIIQIYRSRLFDIISNVPISKPINLPYHSIGNVFKGRDENMNWLFQSFTASRSKHAAITVNAIHGLGGIGKTRLAVEYAWRNVNEYTAILFVAADNPEKLIINIALLATKLVLDLDLRKSKMEAVNSGTVSQRMDEININH